MERDDIQSELQRIEAPELPADFFDRLDERLASEPLPRRPRLITNVKLIGAASTAIAAGLVLVLALGSQTNDKNLPLATPTTVTSVPQSPLTELKPLLAADVLDKASATLSSVQGLSGKSSYTFHAVKYPSGTAPASSSVEDFKVRANGDYWRKSADETTAYNATTGAFTSCFKGNCQVSSGLIATDPQAKLSFGLPRVIEAIHASQGSSDATLQDVTFNSRPAWLVKTTYLDNRRAGEGGKKPTITAEITVDKETSFPLKLTTTWNGQPDADVMVSNVAVNPTFVDSDFTVKTTGTVDSNDGLYKRTTLANAAKAVGYKPAEPQNIPDGFQLAEVSVSRTAKPFDDAQSNKQFTDLAALTYRRGLESFTVDYRRNVVGANLEDLYGVNNADVAVDRSRKTLASGAFAGVNAYVEITDDTTRVWGIGKTLAFSVSGDLSRDELVDVAQSLR